MEWISVTERLPDNDRRVFIALQAEDLIQYTADRYYTNHWNVNTLTMLPVKVLFWCEIPELPKSVKLKFFDPNNLPNQ